MYIGIYLITLVIGIAVLFFITNSNESNKLPCDYLDSINITDGMLQTDESITYNGMTFTKDHYALVDFILENGTLRQIVKPYFRGCVCNVKSCVRLCCPLGSFYQNRSCHSHNDVRFLETEVLDENKQTKSIVLDNHFAYVSDRSCNRRYIADEFKIVHTGSILFEGKHLTHWEYCLNAVPDESDGDRLNIEALVCPLESEQPVSLTGMLLSVPFIIATILVYIILPELHNLYGNCLIYHLMSLATGYIILGVVQLNGTSSTVSESIAYVAHFSFISSFLWVSVISVELYLNTRSPDGISTSSEMKRLISYMIYVWCSSLLLTFVVYFFDFHLCNIHSDNSLKACFLDFKNNTQCAYFYVPFWIIFVISQTFFTMTAIKMHRSKHMHRENLRQTAILLMASRDLHQTEINNEENFALYLRLHLVTCLAWILKGLALLAADKLVIYSNVSYAVQGLVIFVLLVMNRHVLHIISQRWQQFIGKMDPIRKSKGNSVPFET